MAPSQGRSDGEPGAGQLSEPDFARFRSLIYRIAGIRVPETKRLMMTNRLRPRLRATGIATFRAYHDLLLSPEGAIEMPRFLDAVTTNETYFDRDPVQYAWIENTFLPSLLEAGRNHQRPKRLRVWSAACSTGAELYSIALRIHALRAAFKGWHLTLLGTDLSGEALAAAKAGTYDSRALRLLPPQVRQASFEPDPDGVKWTLKPEIRAMATWKQHNLLRPLVDPPFDCILLKNVLIYFDAESKKEVVRNVIRSLAPGGYLVTGLTEGIHQMLDPLEKLRPWLHRRPESAATGSSKR